MSVNFLIHVLKHKVYVMIEGACRSDGHGFSNIAKQEEIKGKENLEKAVRTIKKLNQLLIILRTRKVLLQFVISSLSNF